MNHLKEMLKSQYGIAADMVREQKGGWSAAAYKISAGTRQCFLKVYDKKRASTPLLTAHIDFYVPVTLRLIEYADLAGKLPVPVLTENKEYKWEDRESVYLLYEYIDGITIGDRGLTTGQALQLADIVSRLHDPENVKYMNGIEADRFREDFSSLFLQKLKRWIITDRDILATDIKTLLSDHHDGLQQSMLRLAELSEKLGGQRTEMVLCHTDIHNGNLMEKDGELMLIDWEGLIAAPREADLMFVRGKEYDPEFMKVYQERYPDYQINREILEFYQLKRRLTDIREFIEQLIFDVQSADEREETLLYLEAVLVSLISDES